MIVWFFCRLKYYGDGDIILHHKYGIYSLASKAEKKISPYTSEGENTGGNLYLFLKSNNEFVRK